VTVLKVIFLDIDGVLNSDAYDRTRSPEEGNIDMERLPLLREIVDATGAQIVLASTWREHWESDPALCDAEGRELHAAFAANGLAIFDKTPVVSGLLRPDEIRAWLCAHGEVRDFVILDDFLFGWGADLSDRLVRTSPRIGRGLEARHVKAAIAILNGERPS
jgi:hypothetical protein